MRETCPICETPSGVVGVKPGVLDDRRFVLRRCPACAYAFVDDPRTDFARIYDERYYRGQGADHHIDYIRESEDPRTVRQYEWQAVVELARVLTGKKTGGRWLDYGCGNGGLVRAGQAAGFDARGFEEGWIADRARAEGVSILSAADLADCRGQFDLVTAVEVLEHVIDPVAELRRIRGLLKPGGIVFLTTGNAAKKRESLLAWDYFVPEIHVGLFEPRTVAETLRRAGFAPEFDRPGLDYTGIIRFKVLKALGVSRRAWWEAVLPWSGLARIIDRAHGVSAHPIGRAI